MRRAAKRRRTDRRRYPRSGWMWNPYWRAGDFRLAHIFAGKTSVPVQAVQKFHADCVRLWLMATMEEREVIGEPHWKDDPTYNLRRRRT